MTGHKNEGARTVSIAKLKDRLSYYVKVAKRGTPVWITDRRNIVAKIEQAEWVDMGADNDELALQELEQRGQIVRGDSSIDLANIKPVNLSRNTNAVQLLIDDRNGRP